MRGVAIIGAGAAVLVGLTAALAMLSSRPVDPQASLPPQPAPAARRPEPAPAPVTGPAAVVARLRDAERATETVRLVVEATVRQVPLSVAPDTPPDQLLEPAREALAKAPPAGSRTEHFHAAGEGWRREIVMPASGNARGTRLAFGSFGGFGRNLIDSAAAGPRAIVSAPREFEAIDQFLRDRASELLSGVQWSTERSAGGVITLSGKRGTETVELELREQPRLHVTRLLVLGEEDTPLGKVPRGSEFRAESAPEGGLRWVQELSFAAGNRPGARVARYQVQRAERNVALGEKDLQVQFPRGTAVTDMTFDPPLRYTQGDRPLTDEELRARHAEMIAGKAKVGEPAPDWSLKGLDGKTYRLSGFRGRPVLLSFFASWCAPCAEEAPMLEKGFWQRYRDQGLVVIGVNTNEEGDHERLAREFVRQHGVTYPTVIDGNEAVARDYGVTALPTVAVVDRAGKLVYKVQGFTESAVREQVETVLRR